jgi:hypothetical protein
LLQQVHNVYTKSKGANMFIVYIYMSALKLNLREIWLPPC